MFISSRESLEYQTAQEQHMYLQLAKAVSDYRAAEGDPEYSAHCSCDLKARRQRLANSYGW
jgi:trehalose/maltose hydrolase-like predicted phosphorylase